jgi:hypothetical protein
VFVQVLFLHLLLCTTFHGTKRKSKNIIKNPTFAVVVFVFRWCLSKKLYLCFFKIQMQQCLITKINIAYYSWVPQKLTFETYGKGKQPGATSCGCTMLHCSVNSVACLYCRIVHVNVNNNFFCFF